VKKCELMRAFRGHFLTVLQASSKYSSRACIPFLFYHTGQKRTKAILQFRDIILLIIILTEVDKNA